MNAKFREYLEGGVKISLDIALDFTISNGEPSSQYSLHNLSQTGPNFYQKVGSFPARLNPRRLWGS